MNAKISFCRAAAIASGLVLALSGAARAAETDTMSDFENYIKFSGYTPDVSGSNAAFARRAQTVHRGAAGIEDANYNYDLTKDVNLQIDGHAMAGYEDYLAHFKLTKNEVGSVEAGYKRFRTFYDAAGGFFPLNNAWITLYPREQYIDRGKFFANVVVALPKAPVFEFHYTNELRSGSKDSTIWGDSDFTGIPIYSQSSLNPVTSTRKILPAVLQINERNQEWQFVVRHTVGNTTASLSLIGTRVNNLDSRSVDRYTNEIKPYPAIPSTPVTLVPASKANNPNFGSDIQGFNEHALTYMGKIETKATDWATIFLDASYRHSAGDTSASRLISASINTVAGTKTAVGLYTAGGRPPYSYTAAGTLRTDTTTGVLGLRLTPLPALAVNLGLRGEASNVKANSQATYVSTLTKTTTGTLTPVTVTGPNWIRIDEKPWTPEIDVRYSGIKNLALYGTWDYRSVTQDEKTAYTAFTVNTSTGALTGPINLANDAIKENHANVTVGANWTPYSFLTFRPEVYTKDHSDSFTGYGTSAGDLYVLDYDMYGTRISAIVKPLSVLSLNTRYIVQKGKAKVNGDGLGTQDSNDARRYEIAETIDWTPVNNVYFQLNANLVWDTIKTSYPVVTGLAKSVNYNSDNNYWNGSFIAGLAVDKHTDAQLQATYYKSNNYNPAITGTTMAYGMSGEETTVTIGVKHKFTDRMLVSAKVGYFDSTNATAGGFSDFHGPLAYVAVEYGL